MSKWTKLGKDKLASSGLDTKQAETLGIYEVPSAKAKDKCFDARPALIIPYFGLDGKGQVAQASWPDFYRLRYLDKGTDIAAMATEKGDQRYAQPPRTGVCAYFPKLIDWQSIADDPSIPIIITEGELKAAAGCAKEWAVIGLGGVWNFKSSSQGYFFLPELEKVSWFRRQVYILYDSDFRTKAGVCLAINALAEELLERGALPFMTMLPDVLENGKTGLDDYLLQATDEDFQRVLAESQPLTMARNLWRLNKEVVYVNNPGIVVQLDDGFKMSPAAFKEHSQYSTQVASEQSVNKEGEIVIKKVSAAPLWLKWPLRHSASRITFQPGKPKITEEGEYNQWEGWGVQPKKGNVKPFLDLVRFIFKDMEPELMEWFLDWCAYPIQNPGSKMFTCVVVWGVEEGTGKSLIGYTLGQIYGKGFKETPDDDLEGGYTAWAENKQFVMGDEITGQDNRAFANKLKRFITQRSMTINIKFVPQYEVPDCINYYFTSNHADAFFMSDKDRRNFVVEVQGDPLPEDFYETYDQWLWGDGPAHLMQWLQERQISKRFNPSGKAPYSAAKERMIKAGKGELTAWINELIEQPGNILRTGKLRHTRDLWTSTELLSFYRSMHDNNKVTAVGLGKALSNAGIKQAAGGQPLRAPDGSMNRYYIIRNRERWGREKNRKALEKELTRTPVPMTGAER